MTKETHYTIKGKTFETLDQASYYADYLFRKTGIVYCIESTYRQVTHFIPFMENK